MGGDSGTVFKTAKALFEDCSADYQTLTNTDRYDFVELCCSPNSVLAETCIAYGGKAFRLNLANGYDLSTRHGIDRAKEWIRANRPREGWVSFPCTPWSPMQNLTPMTPEREVKLASQRKHARRIIRLVIEVVERMVECGCDPAWEWPLRASSWSLPEMERLFKLLPHKSRPDGCAFDMRAIDTGELLLKSWRIQTRTEEQARRINIQCQKNHEHAILEGSDRVNASAYYPKEMAKRWVRGMLKKPDMKDVCRRLMTIDVAPVTNLDDSKEPTKAEKNTIQALLSKIHRSAAHWPSRNLARVLKDDGAPDWVIKAALDFKCDTCLCHSRPAIKPPVSVNYETRLWQTVGIDQAELERHSSTVTFQLYVEAACGLCVPNVLFKRNANAGEHRNPTAAEVTDGFAEAWIAHYPKSVTVRTDPEGSFQR